MRTPIYRICHSSQAFYGNTCTPHPIPKKGNAAHAIQWPPTAFQLAKVQDRLELYNMLKLHDHDFHILLFMRNCLPQVLKWARENSCPWDEEVCASAASGGHLALLKYCWAHRCPWNEYTCELAAEGGHLEVLKWARSKGCPWDEDVCAFAAEEGHMEVRPS